MSAPMYRNLPILCLDFDGVIHSYESGWMGAGVILDPPVRGSMEFIEDAVRKFRVAIYSSRSVHPEGIAAMREWLSSNLRKAFRQTIADEVMTLIEWPTEKPPAMVTIDDRAICFTGAWPTLDALASFKPWNKRGPASSTDKHTPGPWEICLAAPYYHYQVGSADGTRICMTTDAVDSDAPPDQRKANAILIANAPALLEACRFAAGVLSTDPVEVEFAQARLREVVAKATGVLP